MNFYLPCEVVVLCLFPPRSCFNDFFSVETNSFPFMSMLNPKSLQSLFSTMWESHP